MRTVEYRIWGPEASPLRVVFPQELLRDLGIVETSGVLRGSRHGRVIRISAQSLETEYEEQEKVGVFVSRIRGEVFLTEADLTFFNKEQGEVALVVAGDRAGFFVREADGSIQTVRSHEEFCIAPPAEAAPKKLLLPPKPARTWKWTPAGLVTLAALPLAALAMFPQHARPSGKPVPSALEVRETGGQLRISWRPGQNAMLSIDDGGSRFVIPIYSNQSNLTYRPLGSEVAVTLTTADPSNQPHRDTALYISSTGH
jgi:hypothetical protein